MTQPQNSNPEKNAEPISLQSNESVKYSSVSSLPVQGWQCPLCRRIFAPHISECTYCNSQTIPVVPTTPIYPYPTVPYNPWAPNHYPEITWTFVEPKSKVSK